MNYYYILSSLPIRKFTFFIIIERRRRRNDKQRDRFNPKKEWIDQVID